MDKRAVEVVSTLTFRNAGGVSASERWLELLAQLEQRRSIVAAAQAVGLSYKAAWDAIDTMNNLSDTPLVARSVGGRGGGGTRLTPSGRQLVQTFRAVQGRQRALLRQVNRQIADPRQLALLGRLGVVSSARNQLAGTVTRVRRGTVNDEIELALSGGERLVAIITHESTQGLGLRAGAPVMAWIKASWPIIALGDQSAARCSARNRLAGHIARVTRGAVNTELVIQLNGGNTLAATVTNGSVRALGLKRGVLVTALIKASSVILVAAG